jgi:hypothetical protein
MRVGVPVDAHLGAWVPGRGDARARDYAVEVKHFFNKM